MIKVFIDGSAGTTGLRIHERLQDRSDLELIILPDEVRKDDNARREALHAADIAFLCLPDAAAKESIALAIVLDEYGATAGLVTLEDLLEEIVKSDEDALVEIKEEDSGEILFDNYIEWSKTHD